MAGTPVTLRVTRVGQRGPPLDLPRYETEGSAGPGLRARGLALPRSEKRAWTSFESEIRRLSGSCVKNWSAVARN